MDLDTFRPGNFLRLLILLPIIALTMAVWFGIAALVQWLGGS
jgi:hypothetical protein